MYSLVFDFYSCQKDAIRNGKLIQASLTVLTHIAYNKQPLDVLPVLSEAFTNKNFMAHDFTKVIRFLAYLHTFVCYMYYMYCNCSVTVFWSLESWLTKYLLTKYSYLQYWILKLYIMFFASIQFAPNMYLLASKNLYNR